MRGATCGGGAEENSFEKFCIALRNRGGTTIHSFPLIKMNSEGSALCLSLASPLGTKTNHIETRDNDRSMIDFRRLGVP